MARLGAIFSLLKNNRLLNNAYTERYCLQEESEAPFEKSFTDCRIWSDYEGSDHAPVWADLKLPGPLPQGARPPPLDVRNRQSSTGALRPQALLSFLSVHSRNAMYSGDENPLRGWGHNDITAVITPSGRLHGRCHESAINGLVWRVQHQLPYCACYR